VAHGGQGKIDEKGLGAGLFQEGAEKNEKDDVGGQHVGHDAEDPVAHVVNGGAHVDEGRPRVLEELRGVGPIDPVKQHDDAHDHEGVAHHPPGQFDADEDPHHGHATGPSAFSAPVR
jgi:hypothetical protein